MRIYWDITKTVKNRVYSGLNRVSQQLQAALETRGYRVIPVAWSVRNSAYLIYPDRKPAILSPVDIFITPELFSANERTGVREWLKNCEGVSVAIFHDAIPLKHPEFTWPKSVARHPYYLKDLAKYDLVLANSDYSRDELTGYWRWLNVNHQPPVISIPLGADFCRTPRATMIKPSSKTLNLLMVGIMEPRKNHEVVLSAIEILRAQGKKVELNLVGRVNPHFGKPIQKRVDTLVRRGLPILHHGQVEDDELLRLYEQADITLFPSLVEGNGLPVIESIWKGIPTLASPIPPHLEHAGKGKGIRIVDPMDATHLAKALNELIDQPDILEQLKKDVLSHKLPTWDDSADATMTAIGSLKNG